MNLEEFFTYDDIAEHVILCHETCEESCDVDSEKDRSGRPSLGLLVKAASEHICGDGKWKKEQ